MPKVGQLTLSLASKPGVLAQLTGALARAGVNIQAICAPEVTGKGRVRVVVDDSERARSALKAAKLRAGEEEAIAVTLENRPGALAQVAERLAQGKVNIKCAYATTHGAGPATAILTVSNTAKALALLGG